MATVSLSMIVRDAQPTLARAIVSALPYVDEVVVVDTGSTDRSVLIAERLGARVIRHPFEGFAASRNRSLAACTGDWVLVLDADEELAPESGAVVKALAATSDPVGYYVRQRNHVPGQPPGDVPVVRLFPRVPGARFEGALHEKLVCDRPEFRRAWSEILIHHWGAAESLDPTSAKSRRYEAILRSAIAAAPHDAELWSHLAVALCRRQADDEALEAVATCDRLAPPEAICRASALEAGSACLLRRRDFEGALAMATRGLAVAPGFPPFWLNAALAHWGAGRVAEAEVAVREAIAAAEAYRGTLPFDGRLRTKLAPRLLAACEARMKEGAPPGGTPSAQSLSL